jgi:hypothetical protein
METPWGRLGQINCRSAVDDPLGNGFAGTWQVGESTGVESRRNEKVLQFRRFAYDEMTVGRKTLWTAGNR